MRTVLPMRVAIVVVVFLHYQVVIKLVSHFFSCVDTPLIEISFDLYDFLP